MDEPTARSIARAGHAGQRDRRGLLRTEHVERVAASVPAEARAIALLHDLLEWTDTPYEALRAGGLTEDEAAVLELLTRTDGEPYATHVLRIARARGAAGRLARAVEAADLDEHLAGAAHDPRPEDPPYAWARRHIGIAQKRRRERAVEPVAYFPAGGRRGALPALAPLRTGLGER
jgi:hypothetical protein